MKTVMKTITTTLAIVTPLTCFALTTAPTSQVPSSSVNSNANTSATTSGSVNGIPTTNSTSHAGSIGTTGSTNTTGNSAYSSQGITPSNNQQTGVIPGTGATSGSTNYTGTTVYDNGTGTNVQSGNARTGANTNSSVTRSLSLQGMKAQDNQKIVQLAKDAGAVNPRVENGTLKYSGGNFNQQQFVSAVTTLNSDIKVNNMSSGYTP